MRINPIPRELIQHLGVADIAEESVTESRHNQFYIDESDDRYIIAPVPYNHCLYRVSLSKKLLSDGKAKSPEGWKRYLAKTDWRVASGPLATSLLTTLYREREGHCKDLVEIIRKILHHDYTEFRMATSTRIMYATSGLDEVIHDYGTPDAYAVKAKIYGPVTRAIHGSGCRKVIEALLGTRDLTLLKEAIEWGAGKRPWLFRRRFHGSVEEERILALDSIYPDRFSITCTYTPYEVGHVRGVILERIA